MKRSKEIRPELLTKCPYKSTMYFVFT